MPDALLDKLRAAVGPSNVLTGVELSPYVVEGRTPEAAVFPGSVDEVAAVIGLAARGRSAGDALGRRHGGERRHAGHHDRARAGVAQDRRLLEHEPGDLTASVEAGMTVEAFQAALRGRGQWMSLDPADAGSRRSAGCSRRMRAGPRRHLYGTARDLLIGVTVVTAEGAIVRGGGKVVKNVAGYDLPKLFVGSYGTLGVIVEATVKLRPLPDQERLVSIRFDRLKDAGAAARAVMASDLIPNVIELLDGPPRSAAFSRRPARRWSWASTGLTEQVDWQCSELERLAGAAAGGRRGLFRPTPGRGSRRRRARRFPSRPRSWRSRCCRARSPR